MNVERRKKTLMDLSSIDTTLEVFPSALRHALRQRRDYNFQQFRRHSQTLLLGLSNNPHIEICIVIECSAFCSWRSKRPILRCPATVGSAAKEFMTYDLYPHRLSFAVAEGRCVVAPAVK